MINLYRPRICAVVAFRIESCQERQRVKIYR